MKILDLFKSPRIPRKLIAPAVQTLDVSDFILDLDLRAFDVLKTAPVWMTRAERVALFSFAYTLRPKRYLEIGTLNGGSALTVCKALDAGKTDCTLVCVDPEPRVADETWDQIKHRAHLVKGFSPQALPEAERVGGGKFDFVLIDGDHTYAGAKRDAEGVLPFCSDAAYIFFHDCFYPDVQRAIDQFVQAHAECLVDCGPMTRETSAQEVENGAKIHWGGLRLVQVRR